VEVGTKLAQIGGAPSQGGGEPAPAAPAPPPEPATQQAADESMAAASEGVGDVAPNRPPAREPAEAATTNGKTFVSPVVARIASEHGVDPNQVQGTGRGGRVTKKDILDFIESGPPPQAAAPATPAAPAPPPPEAPAAPAAPPPPEPAPPPAPAPAAAAAAPPKPAAAPAPAGVGESFEPMTAMRRGIAEHMRRSLDTSAHVTSAIEVDMSRVVAIRGKLKQEYESAYGVNPTYLAFIARAVVETLREYPWVNGEIRGDQIVTRNYVNLGFAVE